MILKITQRYADGFLLYYYKKVLTADKRYNLLGS